MHTKHIKTLGVFDSGVGGLSVLQQLTSLSIPHFIYFADTANLPYGEKSPADIITLTSKALLFLKNQNVDGIVIACHTASSLALDIVRNHIKDIPIWSVIDPAVTHAVLTTRNNRIGIIGTPATIASAVHEQKILKLNNLATVFSVSCPKLVPLIEAGLTNKRSLYDALHEYLEPLIDNGIDTLILGCTHYELIKNEIVNIVGSTMTIISVPELVTQEVQSQIQQSIIQSTTITYHITGNTKQFVKNGKQFTNNQTIKLYLHKLGQFV